MIVSNYSSSIIGDRGEVEKVWEKWAELLSSRRFRLMEGTFVDLTPAEEIADKPMDPVLVLSEPHVDSYKVSPPQL